VQRGGSYVSTPCLLSSGSGAAPCSVDGQAELEPKFVPGQVQPTLAAPPVEHRPGLEDRHPNPPVGRRQAGQRAAVGPRGGEPGHQVIAVDYQILDDQMQVGEGGQSVS
jgi:hypothetical protein